ACGVQHKQRVTAKKACGVDAEREIFADALCRVGLYRIERPQFIPFALHGPRCFTPGGKTQGLRYDRSPLSWSHTSRFPSGYSSMPSGRPPLLPSTTDPFALTRTTSPLVRPVTTPPSRSISTSSAPLLGSSTTDTGSATVPRRADGGSQRTGRCGMDPPLLSVAPLNSRRPTWRWGCSAEVRRLKSRGGASGGRRPFGGLGPKPWHCLGPPGLTTALPKNDPGFATLLNPFATISHECSGLTDGH